MSFYFLQVEKSANATYEKGFNFDDPRLLQGAWRNEPNPDICKVDCFVLYEQNPRSVVIFHMVGVLFQSELFYLLI